MRVTYTANHSSLAFSTFVLLLGCQVSAASGKLAGLYGQPIRLLLPRLERATQPDLLENWADWLGHKSAN